MTAIIKIFVCFVFVNNIMQYVGQKVEVHVGVSLVFNVVEDFVGLCFMFELLSLLLHSVDAYLKKALINL